ncbi:tetratricopeptide repeat protein [Parvibaculum sp.]|uniref:tetratricopeptide repeat protein n=1 Tax=Parvibaculum sp. TaxID=2024848 RepID=UPI00320D08AE
MALVFRARPAAYLLGMIAAALLWGAAVATAEPVQTLKQPAPLPPPSERFLKGVEAYDSGDFKQAFDIWLPLAQGGDLAAMRNVALLLRTGKGTDRDPARALWFYEEAGSKGFGLAQLNAAFMHLKGDGVPKNLEAAAFWFHAAALSGSPIAQYNLAVMYERGQGVEKDLPKALGWYALASRSGSRPALDRLAILVPSLEGPKAPKPADAAAQQVAPAPPAPDFELRGTDSQ